MSEYDSWLELADVEDGWVSILDGLPPRQERTCLLYSPETDEVLYGYFPRGFCSRPGATFYFEENAVTVTHWMAMASGTYPPHSIAPPAMYDSVCWEGDCSGTTVIVVESDL